MRINVLQHTPNEGPGFIKDWAIEKGHDLYIYHPYYFDGILPCASETDMLIILGGPMSPNDDYDWIKQERHLIIDLMKKNIPIFGACFGAQQLAKALGSDVHKSPNKEVGWAPVYLKSDLIKNLPSQLMALHWHEDMFELPENSSLLFSSDLLQNQGFILDNIIGLQFHFEPSKTNVNEIVTNDIAYPNKGNKLNQSSSDILNHPFPEINKSIMFKMLDHISK
ncbi:hypothetical protein P7266_0564 [Lactococcus cremoris]|nr:hypothetical protein P7266_0564 [Lactococcus cremoris]